MESKSKAAAVLILGGSTCVLAFLGEAADLIRQPMKRRIPR
jgi:hypothetical protein